MIVSQLLIFYFFFVMKNAININVPALEFPIQIYKPKGT